MSSLQNLDSELIPQFFLPDSTPVVPASAFVAPGAVLLGAATLGEESSLWYATVVRADINRIIIGAQSNVQDGCVLHVSDDCACEIGERLIVRSVEDSMKRGTVVLKSADESRNRHQSVTLLEAIEEFVGTLARHADGDLAGGVGCHAGEVRVVVPLHPRGADAGADDP